MLPDPIVAILTTFAPLIIPVLISLSGLAKYIPPMPDDLLTADALTLPPAFKIKEDAAVPIFPALLVKLISLRALRL